MKVLTVQEPAVEVLDKIKYDSEDDGAKELIRAKHGMTYEELCAAVGGALRATKLLFYAEGGDC